MPRAFFSSLIETRSSIINVFCLILGGVAQVSLFVFLTPVVGLLFFYRVQYICERVMRIGIGMNLTLVWCCCRLFIYCCWTSQYSRISGGALPAFCPK